MKGGPTPGGRLNGPGGGGSSGIGGDAANRTGRYSKGGSLDSRYGRAGGGVVGVYPTAAGGGGHYLPDLAASSAAAGHYLAELAAPGGHGGHFMTAATGEPYGGGHPAPAAGVPTWQDLIQPRLPHIIKGRYLHTIISYMVEKVQCR